MDEFRHFMYLMRQMAYTMLQPHLTPEENIRRIYENPDWKSHVNERLRYREYQLPKDSEESLEQLVEWYTNKRSKRVAYAGKKLKKLFPLTQVLF